MRNYGILYERLISSVPLDVRENLTPIPWPKGTIPVVVPNHFNGDGPLPKADVVVCTYTKAEGQALADVLSPELELSNWTPYKQNFSSYLPDLTWRSPAKEAKCLGQYALVDIGSKRVLLFRSELHLATDSKALPLRRLWNQMIDETSCSVWIDTGTAGGIGSEVVEGDTVVAANLMFDCTGQFKSEPWAHQSFKTTLDVSGVDWEAAEQLMTVNARMLRPEASRDPKVWHADVITCDSFLFDDVEDSFGLQTYDNGAAQAEEMDSATICLCGEDQGDKMPKYISLRSISDPQMPRGSSVEAEKRAASQIYLKYGYAAQVATLIAVHQVIASLA